MAGRRKKPKRPKCLLCKGTGKIERISYANPRTVFKDRCYLCYGKKRRPVMVDVYDILEALYDLNTGAAIAMSEFIEEKFALPDINIELTKKKKKKKES